MAWSDAAREASAAARRAQAKGTRKKYKTQTHFERHRTKTSSNELRRIIDVSRKTLKGDPKNRFAKGAMRNARNELRYRKTGKSSLDRYGNRPKRTGQLTLFSGAGMRSAISEPKRK